MPKRRLAMLLLAELGIACTCGAIMLIATKDGQTCEGTAASCGLFGPINVAWYGLLLAPATLVATLVISAAVHLKQRN